MTNAVDVSVRPATIDDVEFLATAHRDGHAAIADARGGLLDISLRGRAEPIETSFVASLADELTLVTIGAADGLAVGYLTITIETLRGGDRIGRVTDLWVHPDARGIGVGGSLMRDAMESARARQCVGIDARALPGDRITKNFFESFGLVARCIEVHKAL